MEQRSFMVKGMSCGHCVNSIEGEVRDLEGVGYVKVHLKSEKVDVQFDAKKITLNRIKDVIEEQGYEVKPK
ncbi:copper chaperone CopZ [Evansella sp. AB-P1]|uniref:copper chaperone CopZ n=1 Tax=Evansella sp. AB-P1 TaxID=3037653 RepID=UPI00241BED19|nr:copper chaperone CopZ [Evansella sp. AB-P1]MDG5788513.1 copper chaperone CopZ [Evansella sp. AB-P1]